MKLVNKIGQFLKSDTFKGYFAIFVYGGAFIAMGCLLYLRFQPYWVSEPEILQSLEHGLEVKKALMQHLNKQ